MNLNLIKKNDVFKKALADNDKESVHHFFELTDEKIELMSYLIIIQRNDLIEYIDKHNHVDYNARNNIFLNQSVTNDNKWALNFLLVKSLNNNWYQNNNSENLCKKVIKIAIKHEKSERIRQTINWYQENIDENIAYFLSSDNSALLKSAINEKSFECADLLLKYNRHYLENNHSLWKKVLMDNELSDYFFDKKNARTYYKDVPFITIMAIIMDKNYSEKEENNIKKCFSYFIFHSKNIAQTQDMQGQLDSYLVSALSDNTYQKIKTLSQYLLNLRMEKHLPITDIDDKTFKI